MSGILRRAITLLGTFILVLGVLWAPAAAHKKHREAEQPRTELNQASPAEGSAALQSGTPTAEHGSMGEMMGEAEMGRPPMSFGARLLDWLGRLHPVIVHFPIAFFPAALFTAIVGRRRPAFAAPVQFLVVAGGIIAPIAAILGWFDAMGAEPSQLLTAHRWLGSAIGAGALALAIWALRKPERDRSTGVILSLSVMTAAIVVQGWFGGALVHGMDHMNW